MIVDILLIAALISFMLLFFVEKEQNADLDFTFTTYKISKQHDIEELNEKIKELEGRDIKVRSAHGGNLYGEPVAGGR